MKWVSLLGFFLLDIGTKLLALSPFNLEIGSIGGIDFALKTVFNSGAAWGLFTDHAGLLFFIRIAIISGLVIWQRPLTFPLLLIMVGAIGNSLDYLLYGAVVDFLSVTFWGWPFPIFNIADSLISVGALLLLLTPKPRLSNASTLHT